MMKIGFSIAAMTRDVGDSGDAPHPLPGIPPHPSLA
jgi:hypothetical protein